MNTNQPETRGAVSPPDKARSRLRVEELVRERLAAAWPLADCCDTVTCKFVDGLLTLRGRVSTDGRKAALGTLLRDVREVVLIDNQVHVIGSTGVSDMHTGWDCDMEPRGKPLAFQSSRRGAINDNTAI